MRDYEGFRRAFIWSNKAWYAQRDKAVEIMFGLYHPEGGTSGEMGMRWEKLNNLNVPQLQVFDDAWSALAGFTDVVEKLGKKDDENITPEQFVEILLSCGFVDDTEYQSPYEPEEIVLEKELIDAENRVKSLKAKLNREAASSPLEEL